jgi:hypothetical protein
MRGMKENCNKIIAYERKNSRLKNFIDDFFIDYERLSDERAASQIKSENWNE